MLEKLDKNDLEQLVALVVENTVKVLEDKGLIKKPGISEKSAYAKTEALLYNYRGFCRIVEERKREIEELRKYGVPGKSASFEYTPHTNVVTGLLTEEESVESAVHNVERNVECVKQAIALIDKGIAALKNDPYYDILPMRYFEGRTQEDIALELNITQKTVSVHKARLVKELSMRIFPNDVAKEMLS